MKLDKRQCFHDPSYQSTLKINKITSVINKRSRYSCECTVCKRMTDWYCTRHEAEVEAWYECWLKEYA